MGGARPARVAEFREYDQMDMTSFTVAEMGPDQRDYDNWLATLTHASARFEAAQTDRSDCAVSVCEKEDVVQSREVVEILEKHDAIEKVDARFDVA
jgi:hypothetical protein